MADVHPWEADVVLSDGAVAHVRPIRPEDAPAVQTMHRSQSRESRYLRFFAPVEDLTERELTRFTTVDEHQRVALVVEVAGAIIGIGRFDRLPDEPALADVAFNVADAHQGRGIGSLLLEHLAFIGRELGVRRFRADVLPQNVKMVRVFTDSGYEVSHEFDDGVIAVAFTIEETSRSQEVRAAREQRSEARSLTRLLEPAGIVVVGVSRGQASVGARLLRHAADAGYAGRLVALNPAAEPGEQCDGVPMVATWDEVGDVDLAVLAVPAEQVPEVVRGAGEHGVSALLISSTGFAETGPGGAALQGRTVELAHAYGMRVLGPAAYGLLRANINLNLTVTQNIPGHGGLGLFTHSGGVAAAALAETADRGIGVSTFVAAGNRADVSGNDVMQYWVEDRATSVVGLYLQSLGNARKLTRVVRALARTKPVILVAPGHSPRAVPSGHQVRSTDADPAVMDALLAGSGAIRVRSLRRLLDVAALVQAGPLPTGERIGVITNDPGLTALVADGLAGHRLVAARELSVAPEAEPSEYLRAVEGLLADEALDAVVACFMPPLLAVENALVEAVANAADRHQTCCAAAFPGGSGSSARLPLFPMPEDGIAALAHLVRWRAWRDAPPEDRLDPGKVEAGIARELVDATAVEPGEHLLDATTAERLLGCYGIVPTGDEGDGRTLGSAEDPLYGPVVTASGPRGRAYAVPPLTRSDAQRLLHDAGLDGAGTGAGEHPLKDLVQLVARVAALAEELPELARLRLELRGAHVATAEVTLARTGPRVESPRRSLRC